MRLAVSHGSTVALILLNAGPGCVVFRCWLRTGRCSKVAYQLC